MNLPKENNQIIIYKSQDGETKIEVKLRDETVWLSQKQMAELFQKDRKTITEHIRNIFKEGELVENSVCRKFQHTAKDGKTYNVNFYNLDVIISVGYRVKSHRGTQFRIWATQKLKEYIIKGFTLDDERLKNGGVSQKYFDELSDRIREIRTSEKNFYQKVRNIFATSVDYDPKTDYAKKFFATVQNKFHYAITGLTASEIIAKRIDSRKINLGLTNWQGKIITSEQAKIAKNYLIELELKRLNLLVEQFLSFAELQSVEQKVMYMIDWLKKLNGFLIFNEKDVLSNSGNVKHRDIENKVKLELQRFNNSKRKIPIKKPPM